MDEKILEAIRQTIKETVNGKIDRLKDLMEEHNRKHEEDMVEVKEHMIKTTPIIEAFNGINTVGNMVKWIAGVGTAVGVIWLFIKAIAK